MKTKLIKSMAFLSLLDYCLTLFLQLGEAMLHLKQQNSRHDMFAKKVNVFVSVAC